MGLQFANGTIVSGSLDGTMCVWDAETVNCVITASPFSPPSSCLLTFSLLLLPNHVAANRNRA
jgi:WD40 repeat protein